MAKISSKSTNGPGNVSKTSPSTPAVKPIMAGRTGERGTHETLGILSTESPKNVWKPNAGGRK